MQPALGSVMRATDANLIAGDAKKFQPKFDAIVIEVNSIRRLLDCNRRMLVSESTTLT